MNQTALNISIHFKPRFYYKCMNYKSVAELRAGSTGLDDKRVSKIVRGDAAAKHRREVRNGFEGLSVESTNDGVIVEKRRLRGDGEERLGGG